MAYTEQAHCNTNCHAVTTWSGRSPKRVRCNGCKTPFPCPTSEGREPCKHWDCMEARGEARPDSHGVLRTLDELAEMQAGASA